jgi:hypothetical protein
MPPLRFEPTIPAGERPQTHALDRPATGTGGNTQLQEQNHQVALQMARSATAKFSNRYTKMQIIFSDINIEVSEGFLQIHLSLELG